MLSNVIFGNQNDVNHKWETITDNYGNAFIVNESISQKIRLGSRVEPKLEKIADSPRAVTYAIPENIFISNNNKNMNVSFMNYWTKNEEEAEERHDDNIVYITIMNADYKLINYDTKYNIVQTYKKKGLYNGLAIVVPEEPENEDEETKSRRTVFTMQAKDLKLNKFVTVSVDIEADGTVSTIQYPIEDRKLLNETRSNFKKLGDKTKSFLVSIDKYPTSTFIVPSSKVEDIKKIGEKIPNLNIIEVEENVFTGKLSPKEKDKYKKLFTEKLVNNRIRAITTVGLRIPHDFCKEYKILYLFNYDTKTDTIKCIKSN